MCFILVWAPDWWKGLNPKGNRVFTHHIKWAEANNKTEVPKGYVIHHIDENIFNNDPTNLQCMSRSEHMKHHCAVRRAKKVQRLEQTLVGNSISEVHDTP